MTPRDPQHVGIAHPALDLIGVLAVAVGVAVTAVVGIGGLVLLGRVPIDLDVVLVLLSPIGRSAISLGVLNFFSLFG